MRTVLLAVVWILALNLLAALVLALAEVHARRKIRREIDALEQLWHLEQRAARAQQRGTRFAGRTLAAATAMLVLSGVAWASPDAREVVVDTVSGVVQDLTDQPSGDKADGVSDPGPSVAGSSSARDVPPVVTPRVDREPGQRTAEEVAGEAAPPIESPTGTTSPPSATTSPPVASPSPVVEAPVSPPPAVVPFEATATVLSASSIEVGWTAVPTATGFLVERSLDGVTWGPIAQVGPEARSVISSSLEPSTLYRFRVHATMPSGTPQMAEAEATTSPSPLAGPLEVPAVAGADQPAA